VELKLIFKSRVMNSDQMTISSYSHNGST